MKEWKINQELYHRLHNEHSDSLDDKELLLVSRHEDVVDFAVQYFTQDPGWVYPSKSYVVAICYALWISKDFGEDFVELLDDPDLLYGNDPYFKPYNESKDVYNDIIDKVGLDFDETQGVIADIKQYYKDEILLHGN